MVLVESFFIVAHPFVVRPRFRNHHHDGVRKRTTRHHQQLKAVVEHGRITAIGIDDGKDFFDL